MLALLSLVLVVSSSEAAPVASATHEECACTSWAEGITQHDVGLALAGTGALTAIGTVVFSTLVDVFNTPDRRDQKPQNPELVQASGLVSTGLVSLGAALAVLGGAIVLEDAIAAKRKPDGTAGVSAPDEPNPPASDAAPPAPQQP